MRRIVVVVSLALHGLVVFGIYIAGLWRLERLDAGKPLRERVAIRSEGEPEGGGEPKAAAPQEMTRKPKPPPPVLTQPEKPPPEQPAVTVAVVGDGDGSGSGVGPGSGDGSGSGRGKEPPGGECIVEPCHGTSVATPPKPPRPPEPPKIVEPKVLAQLRVSGETHIVPSDIVKTAMIRDGRTKTVGTFKLCLSASGEVTSVTQLGSTKYGEYDARLAQTVRTWKYRPFEIDGRGAPVCGIVTFEFTLR